MLAAIPTPMLEGMPRAELGKTVAANSATGASLGTSASNTLANPVGTFAESMIAVTELHSVPVSPASADAAGSKASSPPKTNAALQSASAARTGFRQTDAPVIVQQRGISSSSTALKTGSAVSPALPQSQVSTESSEAVLSKKDDAVSSAIVTDRPAQRSISKFNPVAPVGQQSGTLLDPSEMVSSDPQARNLQSVQGALAEAASESNAAPLHHSSGFANVSRPTSPATALHKEHFVSEGSASTDTARGADVASAGASTEAKLLPSQQEASFAAVSNVRLPEKTPDVVVPKQSSTATKSESNAKGGLESKLRLARPVEGVSPAQMASSTQRSPDGGVSGKGTDTGSLRVQVGTELAAKKAEPVVAPVTPRVGNSAIVGFALTQNPAGKYGLASSESTSPKTISVSDAIPHRLTAAKQSVSAQPDAAAVNATAATTQLPVNFAHNLPVSDLAPAHFAQSSPAATPPANPDYAVANIGAAKPAVSASTVTSLARKDNSVATNANGSKPVSDTQIAAAQSASVDQDTPPPSTPALETASAIASPSPVDVRIAPQQVLQNGADQISNRAAEPVNNGLAHAVSGGPAKAANLPADGKASDAPASTDAIAKPFAAILSAAIPDQATPHAATVATPAAPAPAAAMVSTGAAAPFTHAASHPAVAQNLATSAVSTHEGPLGANGSSSLATESSSDPQSHRIIQATPTTLEVGVPNGAEGWLKVRAEVGNGGEITASLSAATSTGQDTLHRQLPALNAYLHEERVAVTTTVSDRAFSNAGTGAGNPGSEGSMPQSSGQSDQRSPSPYRFDHPESAALPTEGYGNLGAANEFAAAQPSLALESGRWLNVQA